MTEECPDCGGEAEMVAETHSIHLYRHRDHFAQCGECGHMWAVRGVAENEDAGFAFYDADREKGAERPECSKHAVPMIATKYWPSEGRVQFKCEEYDTDAGEACQRVRYRELVDA